MGEINWKKAGLLLFILLLIITSVIFFFKYQKAQQALTNLQIPQQVKQESAKQLIDEVGKLIVLPKEDPTIATVTDITKLKNQPFFAQAKNGDKVLLYTNAKKAILYRPSIGRIIAVEPISFASTPVATGAAKITPYPTNSATQSPTINK